jgi:integrase
MTVANWLDHWISKVLPLRVANGNLAQSTFANYCDWVQKHIKPGLGHLRLAKLSPSDVDALIAAKREHYSPNSLRYLRATLRKALTDAQRQGLIMRNAAALSEPVRVVKQAKRWLTDQEARSLLKQVQGDRLEALYVLCLSTGLRRGEALAVYWDDIDLFRGTLLVRRAIKRVQTRSDSGARTRLEIGPTKTQSSIRTQLLPQICLDALKKHRARQASERLASQDWENAELVFTTPIGSAIDPSNFAKWLSQQCIAAGLGHRNPHQLRHSAATLLLAQDVPLHEVSEILGHSSISVTKDVYGHLTAERRRAAAEAMDRILASNE